MANEMEKIAQSGPKPLIVPKGVDAQEFIRRRETPALGKVTINELGTATVNCPYCAMYYRKANPVNVSKWLDTDGERFHITSCDKGHTLRFKSIAQWREERQALGLQIK